MTPIDVVVVTYQSADLLSDCLASLPEGAEVVVVDNASSDESATIAEQHSARVIRNTENTGFARAANQGARQGDRDLVLFLNPDAVVGAADVAAMVAALEADPELAVVGPRLVHPDGDEQRPWWPFPSSRASWAEAIGAHRLLRHGGDRPGFVVGACLLVRRRAFEEVGGFDESFWLYGEEADLAFRLHQRGRRSKVVEGAVCRHVGGASGQGSERSFEEFQRGTERFIAKHEGAAALLGHRIALLTGSLLRLVALTIVGRGSSATAQHRRRIVRRLVRVLLRSPASVPMAPPPGTSLVVFSLEPWDEVWRRNQFLVRELLRADPTLRVLFVEPPADLLHHFVRTRSWPRVPGLRPCPDDPRITLFTPRKVLPRVLGPWADRALLRQARAAMAAAGASAATLWVNDPAYAPVTRWGRPVLYDLTDDWTLADRPSRVSRRLTRWDRTLTSHADVVVACSDHLARSHAQRDGVVVIPNAVDVELFTKPQDRPPDLPDGPCAVYAGTLHEDRLDVDLVVAVARQLPDVAFAFVGPVALGPVARARLDGEPNVDLLGARPYPTVPGYLQHADVVVVPHLVDDFTESLDPIKAYECQAVGRPVVATPVAGFRDTPWATTVAGAGAFAAAVRAAIGAPAAGRGTVPTWQDRATAFAAALRGASEHTPSVVYVGHVARLSGGELALARLLPALPVRAHVILGEDGPLVTRLREAGISVEILPFASTGREVRRAALGPARLPLAAILESVRYTLVLARRLRELQPDVVHTNTLKAAYYGGVAARLAAIPLVIHVRDRIAEDYLPRPAVRMTRLLLRYLPDAVIANSHATLDTLRLPPGRGAVVASPVVCDAVAGPAFEPGGRAAFNVVMIGRIAPWKGQDVFLRAFADAFPDGDERAVVVGSAMFGEQEFGGELKELAVELGIDDRVGFAGFREDIDELLAQGSVLVHASIVPEPFGQVVIEGMAAGLPVVAARAGGPAEVVEDGVDGLLYPPGDHEALAHQLRRLRGDPKLRSSLGEAARRRAADFAPEILAGKVEALYRSVAAR